MSIVKVEREFHDHTRKKDVRAKVFECEECGRWDKTSPDGIWHDALCTSRGEPVRNDQDVGKVLRTLFERANHILGKDLDGVQGALKKLREMRIDPACLPKSFYKSPMYSKGDEVQPFFSEAFLYSLLGKEEARTVLAHLAEVFRAAGLGSL